MAWLGPATQDFGWFVSTSPGDWPKLGHGTETNTGANSFQYYQRPQVLTHEEMGQRPLGISPCSAHARTANSTRETAMAARAGRPCYKPGDVR
jgi:hypothetical protein